MIGRALLEARGLGRRDPRNGEWLLRDIDLQLEAGERLAIVGASGTGKTLLLRSLAQLDPADAGEVWWHGEAIAPDSIPRFRSRVIYLHQKPALGRSTVESVLRRPFELAVHRRRRYDAERARQLLLALGRSTDFLGRSRDELSGGEEQLVAIVRALLIDPEVMLLDEPTAALDGEAVLAVERLVASWLAGGKSERAALWVCHDREQRHRVADRWRSMEGGRLP